MRQAPAVRVACRQGGAWRALQVGLYAAAAAVFAGWCALRLDATHAAALAVACAAGAAAAVAVLRRLPCAALSLTWSGARWALHGGSSEVELARADVMLDLGAALLLRLQAAGGPARSVIWLPVTRRQAGAAFAPLCAALYAARPG